MPYILAPKIVLNSEIMWMEGVVYEKENIYKIKPDTVPPVNYDVHKIKPHSITHAEGSLHVMADGKSIDQYFKDSSFFYGKCLVLKLKGNKYQVVNKDKNIFHWVVTKEELVEAIESATAGSRTNKIEKVLLTTENYPTNKDGYHHPDYVLTLSNEAAEFLIQNDGFNLYGTSWKSSDYMPGSLDRPIHKTLFKKAIIFELLDLQNVPQGEYFFVGFPIRLQSASESPVTPVLFRKDEIL
jgi:arylformamidase